MKIQFFVAIARLGEEMVIIGAGTNRRLIDIQRDSFLSNESRQIGWEAKVNTYEFDIKFENENNKPIQLKEDCDGIREKEEISDEREKFHAEVFGKTESKIPKGDLVV
jgi:hypothetical protein